MHTFRPVWRRGLAIVESRTGSVGSLPWLLFCGDCSAHYIELRCLTELSFEVCALLVPMSTVSGGSRFSIVIFAHLFKCRVHLQLGHHCICHSIQSSMILVVGYWLASMLGVSTRSAHLRFGYPRFVACGTSHLYVVSVDDLS